MQLSISLKSDIGRVRTINQDHYLAEVLAPGVALLGVADGMGGYEAGEVASALAIEHLRRLASAKPLPTEQPELLLEQLKRAFLEANQAILAGQADPHQAHMGTTLTAALVVNASIFVVHTGDSRLYLISQGQITQVTDDHSVVGELVKSGGLTEEEARVHPQRNLLTSALGSSRPPRLDHYQLTWQPGDTLLLCSDGLTNHVFADELLAALQGDFAGLADRLVALANERGGTDNITVVAARWLGGDAP